MNLEIFKEEEKEREIPPSKLLALAEEKGR